MKLWHRWKKVSLPNKLISIFTILAVFVSTLSLGLALVQFLVATRIEKAASAQTDRLVQAAESVTNNLKRANEQQLDAIQANAAQAREEIEAQLRAATAQMQMQMEALRVEQRPWLSVENCMLEREPAPFPRDPRGQLRSYFTSEELLASRLMIRCELANSGKTPALEMLPRVAVGVGRRPSSKPPFIGAQVGEGQAMFPGGRQNVTRDEQTPVLTEPYLLGAPLYVLIRIDYQDAFGTPHWTEACRERTVQMPLRTFNHCGGKADSDELRSGPTR